jgi:hypothetical protein
MKDNLVSQHIQEQESVKHTCNTCSYAIITLLAECTKRNQRGEYLHMGGFCPEERS